MNSSPKARPTRNGGRRKLPCRQNKSSWQERIIEDDMPKLYEMKTKTINYLEIVQADYLSGYKIRLSFSDWLVRVMDFEPFLRKAMNPDITKYRQLRNFKKFHLHFGDLMWGDFDMIFPISDLHRGEI
jgi:hypothetical protein